MNTQPKPGPLIVLAADAAHGWGVAVTMASIIRSNQELNCRINLLHDGMPGEWLAYLRSVAETLNLDTRFGCINVADKLPTGFSAQRHYTRSTYSRYLAPELFPDEDLILYFDSDMLCQLPLRPCIDKLRTDMEPPFAAVTLGPAGRTLAHVPETLRRQHGVTDDTPVFSCGMMAMRPKAWLQCNITPQLFDFAAHHHGELAAVDQDAMNLLHPGAHQALDPRFNLATPVSRTQPSFTPLFRAVFHFCNDNKPWLLDRERCLMLTHGLWHDHAVRLPLPPVITTGGRARGFRPLAWMKFVSWSIRTHRFSAGFLLHLATLQFRMSSKHSSSSNLYRQSSS